jgi:hypothetical protein
MNKILYFLMVGFAFTVLQVGTVEAVKDCSDFTPGTPPFESCVAQNLESAGGTPGTAAPMGAPGSAAAGHMNQAAPGFAPDSAAGDMNRAPGFAADGALNGGPAAQDMGGNMINDGGHGANSAKESRAARIKECVAQAVTAFTKETCKGLQ